VCVILGECDWHLQWLLNTLCFTSFGDFNHLEPWPLVQKYMFVKTYVLDYRETKTSEKIEIVHRHRQYSRDELSQPLSETIAKIANNNCEYYVLLGDININLLSATNDDRVQQYIDTLYSIGCYPVLYKPAKMVNEIESCIGHIYTNNLPNEVKPFIILY